MSIASRIESMSENLEKAYESLEDLGVDFTNIDKNLLNLSTEIESMYDEFPQVTDENTALNLNQTKKSKLKLELKAKDIYQNSFSGKNLLPRPYTNGTKTHAGVTYTVQPDGSILVNGTCTGSHSDFYLYGSYTVDAQRELIGNYIIGGNAQVSLVVMNNTNGTFTTLATDNGNGTQIDKTSFTTGYIQLTIAKGVTVDNVIIKPMVLDSLTDISYEPFVGGSIAPNPDFPQLIHMTNGDNIIKVCKKNIFNKNDITSGYYIASNGAVVSRSGLSYSNFIEVIPNTTYTISGKTEWNVTALYDINRNFISRVSDSDLTTTANTYYIRTVLSTNDLDTIQIEKGPTATTYEQYENQNLSIALPVKNIFNANSIIPTMITNRWPSGQANVTYDSTTRSLTMINPNNDTYIPAIYGGATHIEGINVNVEPFTDYAWSFDIDQPLTTMKNSIMGYNEDTGKYEYIQGFTQKTKFVFNTGKYKIISFRIGSTAAEDTITHFTNFQLEKSFQINTYNPYGEEELELCKIGDYQDYFYKENNNWYKYEVIGKTILNGSESWTYSSGNTVFYTDVLENQSIIKNETAFLCTHFNYVNWNTSFGNMVHGQGRYQSTSNHRIILKNTKYTSSSTFKTWLSANNITIYYILATPRAIQIRNQMLINQLNVIEKAKSYEDQTNILQNPNDYPFIIKATSLKKNS